MSLSRPLDSLLLALACSCGAEPGSPISEEEFGPAYADKFCEQWARCNEDGPPCPISAAGDTTTGVLEECDFDAGAAQMCLDMEWICGISGYPEVVPPPACTEACG